MNLPPLRDTIARYNLMADKGLGQHFLLDLNVTAKIVRQAGDLVGQTVFEIGPGPGGLTRPLLDSDAHAVIAVERDPRCVAALQELKHVYGDRLTLIEADALTLDLRDLAPPPRAIIANLPYNVGTPLLIGWLRQIQDFTSLTLMFQKEVADRILVVPDNKTYGRLSVMCQWVSQPRLLFDLPPQAFTPPPKIISSVVQFTPRLRTDTLPFEIMERVVAAAFGQRRKMLRAALKTLTPHAEALLEKAGIDPTRRAETLSVAEFVKLAENFVTYFSLSSPPSVDA